MEGAQASLKAPGIAQTDQPPMTRALRAGGGMERAVFARTFDEVLGAAEGD